MFPGPIAGQVVDIAQTIAIIYIANLLRIAAKTLTRDMRAVLAQLASVTGRVDAIEARLDGRQTEENSDAKPRGGS
jgi:hypothetical protein